ncbi:MAG: family 78 glycoside hydrolase catalytic domain [Solirubrobacteraceae bacterium]
MRRAKRAASAAASCLILALVAVPAADGRKPAQGTATMAVTDLLTEYAREPLGLDERRPRLSWILESSTRGQAQTAYRLQVATSRELLLAARPDVWDSGTVESSRSVNVAYGGPALESATRYWWRVRAWDVDDRPSAWSDPTWWETGLLQQSEWEADWIGRDVDSSEEAPPPDLEGSQWIWYPEGDPGTAAPPGTRYFRRAVTIPAGKTVDRARMLLTVDDSFIAYVNGREIARSTSTWQHAVTADVTGQLQPGSNVLAIQGTNASNSPAGAIGVLEVTFADDSTLTIRTDEQWKAFNADVPDWNEAGFDDTGWPAALELAPFGEGVWTCCGGVDTSPPSPSVDPLLRKEFSITKPVLQARVYVAGLGYHELRLNGRKVGDHVLEGEVNDFTKRVGYKTYDVTPYLKSNVNAVGVMLGRGFFDVDQTTPLEWHLAPWRDEPKLLLQMEIRYADGSSATIVSDDTWQAVKGPITHDSVFGGEDYDARLERPGWDTADDASQWPQAEVVEAPGGRLVATDNDPVKVADTLRPVGMTEPQPGVYVLDMGHTITGWGRLTVSGAAGTTITMRYGQKLLSDGTVDYHKGWHGGRSQTDRYTLDGEGTETWEPRFSFKSFRYLQVEGLPSTPQADTVVGRSVHSAVASAGTFDSSNALYDTFHDGMRRTILGNLQGYPAVDPFYEKSGWTEDVFVAAQSMIYEFDLARFFGEWLEDVRDSQLPDGHIPIIIPSPGWGYTSWGTPSPVWTAVYPIMAWRMYENYGDRRLLAEHFPAIKRYIDREVSRLQDGIVAAEFLGDWVAPGYAVPPEDTRLAGTAYVYRQLLLVADMAEVLRRPDADHYRRQAALVRDRFNATFLDEAQGHYATARDPGYRQTSNLLPLAFGMVPERYEERVLGSLVADVRARGDHLNTGTLGTEVILPVLTENGYVDVAHAIASQRTNPSWGHWYANGADTMWESWGLNPRSRAHFFLGTIDQWLYEDVAGIEAAGPGFKRIAIRPHPDEGLAEAKGKYASVHGEIESEWEAEDGDFRLEVTIPVNTTATVAVPADDVSSVTEGGVPAVDAPGVRFLRMEDGYAVFEVGSGKYRFEAGDGL